MKRQKAIVVFLVTLSFAITSFASVPGHRQNAIDLVNRALDEVNRGIAAAN